MLKERFSGILKTFDPIKGYGFISRSEGKDLFVYFDQFLSADRDAAAIPGCSVEFSIEQGGRGPVAIDVHIIA
ncbi:cold-shock protein CspB [Undibacterium sp. YM2]|uniref:cold shock domain-containing protein n=1 Tax=Undibacterium sp. YM2 TaxID=2058625 RepID=UPI001331E498|nr:cold shock domain-containing protein [Undibacterium sp. YM2]BBB67890.1 cold-shock protein CspB [Undibacterium sp. YM2]